jgi:hypothetical protein
LCPLSTSGDRKTSGQLLPPAGAVAKPDALPPELSCHAGLKY